MRKSRRPFYVAAQATGKEVYDKTLELYKAGTLVLKTDFTCRKHKGGKLDHRWLGLYTVTQSLGRGLYMLQEVKTQRSDDWVNGVHLKGYVMPFKMVRMVSIHL